MQPWPTGLLRNGPCVIVRRTSRPLPILPSSSPCELVAEWVVMPFLLTPPMPSPLFPILPPHPRRVFL